ncbi:hypothetical protein BDQ17DRAFT_1347208 [Cyathus striatus]|nr:hypothetical protein BDQ17DRAFT_1347208 [Cyathus striatus]
MASPFQHHFDTNYVPSIEETIRIKNILVGAEQEISEIDTGIDHLQRQLDLLQEKRSRIHDLAEKHRTLISPARRLSQDIIQEIFLACLPEDRNPYINNAEAPMLLTRICSSWRNIAHCTLRLWAAIHITLPSINMPQYPPMRMLSLEEESVRLTLDRREAATKAWLDRSGACPLSISVDQIRGNGNEGEYAIAEKSLQQSYIAFLSKTIVPHYKRWHHLDVSLRDEAPEGMLKAGVTAEYLNMLKHYHIAFKFAREANLMLWPLVTSLLSSRVTSATLFNISVRQSDSSTIPQLPWGQLTELNLYPVRQTTDISMIDFAAAILRHCSSLKTLKLGVNSNRRVGTGPRSNSADDGNIDLRHLTTLSLGTYATTEVLNFVKSLYIPSVKYLDFDISNGNDEQLMLMAKEILENLLQSCGDSLQYLGLHSPFALASSSVMAKLLRITLFLKHLNISSCNLIHDKWGKYSLQSPYEQNIIDDDLLDALSPKGKDYPDIICPQLESLEWDNLLVTKITEHGLKEFVRARTDCSDRRITTLRHLRVFVNDFKRKAEPEEDIVSIPGENSAIHFRNPEQEVPMTDLFIPYYMKAISPEVYTKL